MDEGNPRGVRKARRLLIPLLGLLTLASLAGSLLLSSCSEGDGRAQVASTGQSCMTCHNGSPHDDYAGPGIEDPHPFGDAAGMQCTVCHGGNGAGDGHGGSHVPPPPQIGGREQWEQDAFAYFNRLTLAGLDKLPDYVVDGVTYTALDYLQWVNPGDLRITSVGRGCGQCHAPHAESVGHSLLATEAGIFSGASYTAGIESYVFESNGLYEDTASDLAFRAVEDQDFVYDPALVGAVARMIEQPVFSVRGDQSEDAIFRNDAYNADVLAAGLDVNNSAIAGSPLANLFHEQVSFTCGDCHLGSAGANNRYGDFRGSGCSACHLPKSLDGRSRSGDPNLPLNEPLDPDDIDEPELPHLRRHRILSIAKTLPSGEQMPGIDDHTCAGCHQGSNRTVMQYWGIRLDQNADLHNQVQYPADPVSYEDSSHDPRLFDPEVGNHTFNGRNRRQYIRFEDYDGDARDDTPADVHYEAGLGCIDCHGSHDVHGGTPGADNPLLSRMEQAVAIRCESCHGTVAAYAPTVAGTTYTGQAAQLAVDAEGNPVKHVVREADGHYYLTSRLTGARHYVVQTRDITVDTGRVHPFTQAPLWSAKASYAMGRADGDPSNGIGPMQDEDLVFEPSHYQHSDDVSCVACHASWTNTCIGCHLGGEYDEGNNFSNITGERIVFEQANADFVYQTPVPFQLGIGPDNKVQPISPNTDAFFEYTDRHGVKSQRFAFTDRNHGGNNPATTAAPSLSHNVMMPHSIRGRVTPQNEGPRYCSACHLTQDGVDEFGDEYVAFRAALQTGDYASLDFPLLRQHIGQNPGNSLESPMWVHMVAGLGSGLFLFDEHGCAVNPLDDNPNRIGCDGVAPSTSFDAARVRLDLDRIVLENGLSTGSNSHPMFAPGAGPNMREGAQNPNQAGPLGAPMIQRLTDHQAGIVLDSWLNSDGEVRGNAGVHLGETP